MKKKGFILFFMIFLSVTANFLWSQYLEVHHINVNDGDSEIIAFKDEAGVYKFKVLIDGGNDASDKWLLPYLDKVFGKSDSYYFDYIILTHYHRDHYYGLQAALGNGKIKGGNYVDPGGYTIAGVPDEFEPKNSSRNYPVAPGLQRYLNAVGTAVKTYNLKRYAPMNQPSGNESANVNAVIKLGSYNSTDIQLRCVAFWENTLGANGNVVNNDPDGKKVFKNPNNLSIAFMLECGEFRYFLGGDLGGTDDGDYIDQETTLKEGVKFLYKMSRPLDPADSNVYDGHICGFKADHHGSGHANNKAFLSSIHPAVCITSAGDNASWHLPSLDFFDVLNAATPITRTVHTEGIGPGYLQGFYFTNLQNFTFNKKPYNDLEKATGLFSERKNTDFLYNNPGYLVSVKVDTSVKNESKFDVYRVYKDDAGNYLKLVTGSYFCHTGSTNNSGNLNPPNNPNNTKSDTSVQPAAKTQNNSKAKH